MVVVAAMMAPSYSRVGASGTPGAGQIALREVLQRGALRRRSHIAVRVPIDLEHMTGRALGRPMGEIPFDPALGGAS